MSAIECNLCGEWHYGNVECDSVDVDKDCDICGKVHRSKIFTFWDGMVPYVTYNRVKCKHCGKCFTQHSLAKHKRSSNCHN